VRVRNGISAIGNELIRRPAVSWLLAILIGGALHLALWPLSEPPILFSDFYKAYWTAGEHLWQGGLAAGYPFTEYGNWSNLPVLAIPFTLLVPFGETAAGWIYLAIGAAFAIAAWALLARTSGLPLAYTSLSRGERTGRECVPGEGIVTIDQHSNPSPQPSPHGRGGEVSACGYAQGSALAALLLLLFLVNGPLLNTLREGNSTHFVLFYLIAAIALWRSGHDFLAGLMFGLAATIKLPLLLIGAYFVVRRRWTIVAGGTTALGIAVLLSLAAFGIDDHIRWYNETIGLTMGKAVPAFNAQSIDGFLMRLWSGTEELLYWLPIEPELEHKIARYAILALLAGGFGWLIYRSELLGLISSKRGPATPHDLLQICIVLMLGLVISPLTWTHYYCFALIPLGLYLGGRLPMPTDGITRALFWSGYILTALPVIMPEFEIDPNPPPGWLAELAARTIISAWLFGGLLMLAAFARAGWMAVSGKEPLVAPAHGAMQ
jgi:hypothetical protein